LGASIENPTRHLIATATPAELFINSASTTNAEIVLPTFLLVQELKQGDPV
jgi:hypothetical protein